MSEHSNNNSNGKESSGNKEYGYIVRIDQPKDTMKHGTHGWQVRFPSGEPRKYHSKLFSDKPHGGRSEAHKAAEEYLDECRRTRDYTPPRRSDEPYYLRKRPANNTSGKTGVHRTYSYHGRTGKKQEYWEAFCPIGPQGQRNKWTKRFFISTHGEKEAKRLAIEFREMWETAADQGEEAIKEFFQEYYDGYLE